MTRSKNFPARFQKWRMLLLGIVPVYVIGLVLYGQSTDPAPQGYYQPRQPVPHSHALHVGELGLDCRYCHTTVDTSNKPRAAEATCLNCHKSASDDEPEFEPVRAAATGGPEVKWAKIHE